jgi:hypothetical protein
LTESIAALHHTRIYVFYFTLQQSNVDFCMNVFMQPRFVQVRAPLPTGTGAAMGMLSGHERSNFRLLRESSTPHPSGTPIVLDAGNAARAEMAGS